MILVTKEHKQDKIHDLQEILDYMTQDVWFVKEDGKTKFKSSKTGREYSISRHYTCQNKYIVYLITCLLCEKRPQYVGQSIRTMAKRHYGHRTEIKKGEFGMGEHFLKHMSDNNWNVDQVSEYLRVTIIASVDERSPDAKKRLDVLETNFQNRLMTMHFHGGLNDRDDTKRGNNK